MHNPKHLRNKQKHERPPVDWGGLGNEPRNEKLAGIRGPTLFEKDKDEQDKESGPSLLYRFNKNKGRSSGSG